MSHRVVDEWMGEPVETLEDLLRPGLCAVCIGINPAPTSVAIGRYYQGRLGRRFFARLHEAGVVPGATGWGDDVAFSNGIGFTDIVRRPTQSSKELRREELEYGEVLLREKLERLRPQRVIFTFKKTARQLFGEFTGCGCTPQFELAGARVFVMPSTYATGDESRGEAGRAAPLHVVSRRECGLSPLSLADALGSARSRHGAAEGRAGLRAATARVRALPVLAH